MQKQFIQSAIQGITSTKQRAIEEEKQKAIREQINPFNADIDTKLQSAIAELQQKFESERNTLVEAAEKTKADNRQSVLTGIEALISAKYEETISELNKILDRIQE